MCYTREESGTVGSSSARATCDTCGESYGIGYYPFCPHGRYEQKSGELPEQWDEMAQVSYRDHREHLRKGLAKGFEPKATPRGFGRTEY